MSDLAPELEARIARLEGDLQGAVAGDFDAAGWGWIVALGVVLPIMSLLAGWWYVTGTN
jgi:hypothetical protein